MMSRNRARLLWTIAATVAAYSIINVLIFYTTDGFGMTWFTASLLIYGTLFVAAVYLIIADTGAEPVAAAAAQPAAQPVPVLEERPTGPVISRSRVVFETKAGRLIRIESGREPDLTVDYAVATPRSAFPLASVEARIGRLPVVAGPEDAELLVDQYVSDINRRRQEQAAAQKKAPRTRRPATREAAVEGEQEAAKETPEGVPA